MNDQTTWWGLNYNTIQNETVAIVENKAVICLIFELCAAGNIFEHDIWTYAMHLQPIQEIVANGLR